MTRLLPLLLLLAASRTLATGEINVLTDILHTPYPPGCVAISLPDAPASADNTLYDEFIPVPSIGSVDRDAEIRVTIWRMGCFDPDQSLVLVRLQKVSGDFPVLIPQVWAEAGTVDFPEHLGQLQRAPGVGAMGASGDVVSTAGETFILGVDIFSVDGSLFFLPEDYNDLFTLELSWAAFSPQVANTGELFDIPPYVPGLDPPQFEIPLLHGRMSGQYTFDGIPSTGLQLIVGELADDTNFIFAIFFTYMNGEPMWLVGNTGGEPPGFPGVEMGLLRFRGGEFIGLGPGAFDPSDLSIDEVGSIIIEPLDCNNILLGYDFRPLGLG
ncbi:MAG: hypothetical protein EA370_09185, partial [Wenzhouxiangella sp.]